MSTPFRPHPSLRGVFVGSGSDGMSDPRMAHVILELARQQRQEATSPTPIHVMYLGTATYDLPQFAQKQTQCFLENNDSGVTVVTLDLVHHDPPPAELAATIGAADIIVVGGGNTLYAVDRWNRVGGSGVDSKERFVPKLLRQAMERGAVLTGGSAGAICWFDGGHSDSMDPDTYYPAMQAKFGSSRSASNQNLEESSAASSEKKDWNYIRVPGLGFLPGIVCPHHDRIQSNGLLRAHDFDQMLLRQYQQQKVNDNDDDCGEIGIGIDHWAALVIDGDDSYRVVSLEDKPGSVLAETSSFSPDAKGVPGVWIKRVVKDKVVCTLLPASGKLSEVLQRRQRPVKDDKALEQCRRDNPDQGPIRKIVK